MRERKKAAIQRLRDATRSPAGLLPLLVAMLACSPAEPHIAAPPVANGWESLAAADSAFGRAALGRPLGTAVTAVIADDGLLLAPGMPVLAGRETVTRYIASGGSDPLQAASPMRDWRPLTGRTSRGGLHGYSLGVFERPAGAGAASLRYAAYWRRDINGTWQVRALLTVDGPAGDSVAVPDGFGWGGEKGAVARPAGVDVTKLAEQVPLLRATDSVFAEFALAEGLAAAFQEYASPTAVILPGGGAPLWGPAQIRSYFDGTPPADTLRWAPHIVEVAPGADLGLTIGAGVYEQRPPDGGVRLHHTKYLSVWERHEDGHWRYLFDAGNAQPPP